MGGTNTGDLYVGYNSGSSGVFSLGGTGQLSTTNEYVGYNSGATALFQQTGGANTASYLTIGAGGQYQLTGGGTLQISTAMLNQGVVDGGNRPATLSANCLVDLTAGTWRNLQGTTVNLGANSLLIVPVGFNTATGLAGVTTAGLPVHVAGTTLTVPAGQGFGGWARSTIRSSARARSRPPPTASSTWPTGWYFPATGT